MKRIYESSFRYVSAAKTNLRLTFLRIRREQAAAKPISNVATLKKAVA